MKFRATPRVSCCGQLSRVLAISFGAVELEFPKPDKLIWRHANLAMPILMRLALLLAKPNSCGKLGRIVNVKCLIKLSCQIGDAGRLYAKLIRDCCWQGWLDGITPRPDTPLSGPYGPFYSPYGAFSDVFMLSLVAVYKIGQLITGLTVQVSVPDFRSIRGRSVCCAIIDECAFLRTTDSANPDYEIVTSLMPALGRFGSDSMLLIGSTP